MSHPKSDKEQIIYILEQISVIEQYLEGKDEDMFYRDAMLKDACFARLLVLGEHTGRLSASLKEKYNEIEWNVIRQARNYYAHAYDALSWPRVWLTLTQELPDYKVKLEKIISEL